MMGNRFWSILLRDDVETGAIASRALRVRQIAPYSFDRGIAKLTIVWILLYAARH